MIETFTMRIVRGPDDVFGFLVDQANWAAVDPALVDLAPQGALALGRSGTVTRRVAGMRVTTTWEVTEFEPGARLAIRIVGRGYQLVEATTLTAADGGTEATVVDTLSPTSLFGRAFVAMSGSFIRRDLRDRAARLKGLLEADGRRQTGT
jgi:hypothetical protein